MDSVRSPDRAVEHARPSDGRESRPRVTLYSVNWCGWCHRARAWLGRHGIEFDEIEVPDFQPHRSEVIKVSGQMEVPVILVEIGGKRHVFLEESDPRLHALLGTSAAS